MSAFLSSTAVLVASAVNSNLCMLPPTAGVFGPADLRFIGTVKRPVKEGNLTAT